MDSKTGVWNVETATTILAEDNFWGEADGASPPGSGDTIAGSVDVDPFLLTIEQLDSLCGNNQPPVIDGVTADPSVLWPPNHKMRAVTVAVDVSDTNDANPTCKIMSVDSDEAAEGGGDGNTTPDWEITGDLTMNLRAERSGQGDGRIYTMNVLCTDSSGSPATTTVTVTVPHDRGKGRG